MGHNHVPLFANCAQQNPNLPQKIAETDVPRGYIRKINFDVNLPIQTWTPHA